MERVLYFKHLTDVASKGPHLVAIYSLQGVANSS